MSEERVSPVVGYIIAALSGLSVIGGVVALVLQFNSKVPDGEVGGIGVTYTEGAVEPWECLPQVVAAFKGGLPDTKYAGVDTGKIWLSVVPYEGLIPSKFLENGKSLTTRVIDGAAQRMWTRANGSVSVERMFFFTPKHYVAHARQLREGDDWRANDAASGTGPLRDACSSALLHELVQHVLPMMSGEGMNASHSRQDLKGIEQDMQSNCVCP